MFDHDFHFGFEYLSEEETLEGPLRLTALGVETEWYPVAITSLVPQTRLSPNVRL